MDISINMLSDYVELRINNIYFQRMQLKFIDEKNRMCYDVNVNKIGEERMLK